MKIELQIIIVPTKWSYNEVTDQYYICKNDISFLFIVLCAANLLQSILYIMYITWGWPNNVVKYIKFLTPIQSCFSWLTVYFNLLSILQISVSLLLDAVTSSGITMWSDSLCNSSSSGKKRVWVGNKFSKHESSQCLIIYSMELIAN